MSLNDALKHINEAGLLLQKASKTLSQAPIPPPYDPVVGDVISLTWDGNWAAIVVGADHVEPSLKMFEVYIDLDRSRRLTFFSRSQVHRSVKFLRKATMAEMAEHGLKEMDVKPRAGFDINVAVGSVDVWRPAWMLADNSPMVGRTLEKSVIVRYCGMSNTEWLVDISTSSKTLTRAFCETKAQAIAIAEILMGQRLDWKRWF